MSNKPNHQIDSLRELHQFATVELVTRNNNDCIEFQNKNCQLVRNFDLMHKKESSTYLWVLASLPRINA